MVRCSKGITLVEVLFSAALLVIAVTGVFSVAISTTRSRAGLDTLEQSMRSVQTISDVLKNYVTADASAATASFAPGGSWSLPGDGGCAHALAAGCVHEATSYLPQAIRDKHPNARMTYRTVVPAAPEQPIKVEVTVDLP